MEIKGIIPGHRTHLLPESKGILISFNESTIDLSNSNIHLGKLYQIKYSDNIRVQAKQLISRGNRKSWSFCYIEHEEIKINELQLEMAMNVKFLPEVRLYTDKDYTDKFNGEQINVQFNDMIDIDGWKLPDGLPYLSGELNKKIWMP